VASEEASGRGDEARREPLVREPRADDASPQQRADDVAPEQLARRIASELATNPPDVTAVTRAWQDVALRRDPLGATFEETFTAAVLADPERRGGWTKALRDAIATSTANVDAIGRAHDREALQAEADHWLRVEDPFFVWEAKRYGCGSFGTKEFRSLNPS